MKNDHTLISVIVPVYGTETYLPACIESIRSQTYTNLQIILIDDQSPDRCPEICDEYARKDPRITVIHQNNKGVSGARNSGLDRATGEYILFVDSDDEISANAVEILLRDSQNYQADIVWAPQKETSTADYGRRDPYTVYENDDALKLSLNGAYNINAVWGKLFTAKFIDGIRFEEGKNINEDGFFMFQCYLRKPVMIRHDVAIYKYTIRYDSASRQTFSEKYLAMLYFCERKKELIAAQCPQYLPQCHNMEVRTNLLFLDVLCKTTDKKYRAVQRQCVNTVRRLFRYHQPINDHHRKQALIVKLGLYPLYKAAVRLKYRR